LILSLKKVFVLGLAVALLGALSVYGMNLLAGGRSASVTTSTLTEGPLELKLELDKTEFIQGEPINITVSLKNIENTTISVTYAYFATRVGFKIFYSNGTKAIERGRTPLASTEDVSFAPGEQVNRTFVWNQLVDIIVGRTYYGEQQASKGTYQIVGTTGTSIEVKGMLVWGMLETLPMTISIQ
jgi:hypothetical protein